MTPPRPWALAGFSGSGKSTVARFLAAAAGRRLVDLDAQLGEDRVVQLLQAGEGALREAEAVALEQALAAGSGVVVALGGGVLEGEASRRALREGRWLVAWLDVPLTECLARCAAQGRRRPVLEAALAAGPDAVRALHARRLAGAAHATLRADGSGAPEDVARFLLGILTDAESEP